MSESLDGARVALLEARRETELASLVRRWGGEPICVPGLREVACDCADEAARALDRLVAPGAVVVLTTGAGLERWFSVAEAFGRLKELHDALGRATVVCRGPKPIAVLKREGLAPHVRAESPHTTKELLAALHRVPVEGCHVVVVHDGGESRVVSDALALRGARVIDLQPYIWALPEDVEPLRDLVRAMIAGRVDIVAFTTQVQARHLFQVADGLNAREGLTRAMRERILVAAVGPTSAHALEQLGTPAHVVPAQPKMGAMVAGMAGAHARRGERPERSS